MSEGLQTVARGVQEAIRADLDAESVLRETPDDLHDFRNVLVGIRMCSDVAWQSLPGESRARTYIERIQEACAHADEMCRARMTELADSGHADDPGGRPQRDDVTAVLIKVASSAAGA